MRNTILLIILIILSMLLVTGCSSGKAKASGDENTRTDLNETLETSSTEAVEDDHSAHDHSTDATTPPVLNDGGNLTCPVTGNDINPDFFVEYNGKRVYVCCEECLKKVTESPAEWYEKAYGDA